MAKQRRTTSTSSDEEDPTTLAIRSQTRIFELKRQRDQQLAEVVKTTQDSLAEIESRIALLQAAAREKSAKQQASVIQDLIDSIRQRKAIEDEVKTVVTEAHSLMTHLEELMGVAFEGRQLDASRHLAPQKD